jgi:hypothetical protein
MEEAVIPFPRPDIDPPVTKNVLHRLHGLTPSAEKTKFMSLGLQEDERAWGCPVTPFIIVVILFLVQMGAPIQDDGRPTGPGGCLPLFGSMDITRCS